METAGGPWVLLEDDRVLDPGLGQDEVLPGGGLLVGRDSLVDQGFAAEGPFRMEDRTLSVVKPCQHHHRI
jgi:hypothetical protein